LIFLPGNGSTNHANLFDTFLFSGYLVTLILITERILSMIEANKAFNLIMERPGNWGTEKIQFSDSNNRILAEDIFADRDFPPFDRVSMDGIGIVYQHLINGQKAFEIEGLQAAGSPQMSIQDPAKCLEVMTGAMLPKGLDTVIPYEHISIKNGMATINIVPDKKWKNIHKQAIDKNNGDLLIEKGQQLGPAEIGILATVGKTMVEVMCNPRVAIVSSGDELIDANGTPEIHQIRKSNVWALRIDLLKKGISPEMFHLIDSKEDIKKTISLIINNFDVVMMSGGVSKGKLDYIPEILEELNIEKVFHRVKQRPGKPFWFGVYENKVHFFAFPGNPVSTFSNFHRYFLPWYYKSLKAKKQPLFKLKLTEAFDFNKPLTYFLQVKIVQTANGLQAKPMMGKGSGDLANLLATDGFLVIPENVDHCPAGSEFEYIAFRDIGL
jgi:molybdopterin molybdotransferase